MENLIEDKTNKNQKGEEDGEAKKRRPVIKSATDLQRLKLEKLMKNPEKPIIIPEAPKEKDYLQTVPSFVRNVMGSSAGAGSGEFHVYRHLRRKEYARQKCIQAKSMREQLDDEYQSKLDKNRLEAEAKTAKKRAKRLKKKQRAKKPKSDQNIEKDEEKQDTSEDDEENEEGAEVDPPRPTATERDVNLGCIEPEEKSENTAAIQSSASNLNDENNKEEVENSQTTEETTSKLNYENKEEVEIAQTTEETTLDTDILVVKDNQTQP